MIPDSPVPVSPSQPSTQTWAAIATAIAGAVAVIAKKKFSRGKSGSDRPSTLNHQLSTAFDSLNAKLDSNQKELTAAISAQSTAIEKRLDSLESAVARLDERTRIHPATVTPERL